MRKRTKLSLSSSSSPSLCFPLKPVDLAPKRDHLLKPPPLNGSEAMLPCETQSAPPSPDSKTLSKSVFFWGWRSANTKFQSWAKKMAHFHEPTWRKAGIFEAVMSSTYRIIKNTDLVLGITEKWCPDTKTFVFPWGETAITLEDVMVLSGFSVLGSPVFATLDSSGEKIKEKLYKEWKKIRKDKVNFVTQVAWMGRFLDSGDELEHVAFLALWLCYFVFPSRFYYLSKAVFPIAVHLSCGTRIALAPAVLAHLYAELSLLKTHITTFNGSAKVDLTALFKLVQVWTWERFKELQPKRNPLFKGEPRLALWHDLRKRTSDARQILDNSKMDSFEWRPYTKTVKKWEFPKFYPEEAMWAPAGPNLDDVFISFARCTKVSALVGIDNVEHYFPNRVASQFGMLQDVPCIVNQNKLSPEVAWNDYYQPINDLKFYIPSRSAIPRVTPTFCEWWRKTYPELRNSSKEKDVDESAETLKARNIIGDDTSFVPPGSKMNRKSEDHMKIAEHLTNQRRKYIKQARDKRCKYMKQVRENGNNESAETLKSRNSVGDDISFVVSSSKMNRTSKDEMKIAEDSNKRRTYLKQARDKRLKYMKQARDKRLKYMKQARKNGNNELAKRLKSRNVIGNDDTSFVVSGSKVNRTSKDGIKIAEDLNKRRKYMKRARENDDSTMGRCQTQVHSDNDEEDDSLSIAQFPRLNKKKYSDVKNSGRDFSEQLDKKSTLEAGNNDSGPFRKVASIRDDGDSTLPPPEKEQRNEETDEKGSKTGKNMVESPFDENNSLEPPFGDIVVSPPETRQTCDDELDVYGNNAEKKNMVDDGSKKPDCLLHEDGIIAGEKASSDEKLCRSEAEKEDDVFVDDDSLIQKKVSLEELALKADNNEPIPHQKLVSGDTNGDETSRAYKSKVLSPSDESNIHIVVGEGSQGHDCLLHDNALGNEETMKSSEQLEDLEKRNNDSGDGEADNDSYEKRFQELKVLALSIKEHFIEAQRNVAELKERSAIRQRKIAAARWV